MATTRVDLKALRDQILAEQLEDLQPAQEEAASASNRANWGRVAATLGSAFSGRPADTSYWDRVESQGRQGLADARGQSALKTAAMGEARQIAASQDAAAKEAEENDPQSETSQQDAEFAGKLTGKADVFRGLSSAQIKKAAPFLKEFFAQEEAKRSATRKNVERTEERTYREGRDDIRFEREKELARIRGEQAVTTDAQKGLQDAAVPGLEIAPGAHPSTDDAKKMKAGLQSLRNIETEADRLKTTYQDGGASIGGPRAQSMDQAVTAMQMEAKNISELGALSGPDLMIIKRLSALNPTGFSAAVKEMFGTQDTMQALEQFRSWAKERVQNAKKTYGYRDPASAGGLTPDKKARLEELRRKAGQ